MKKRITVFILLVVMLVGVFGSVSVYASEINYSQAKFTSVSAMNTYDGDTRYPVESNGVTVCSNAWINSITVDDYCVLGLRNTEVGYIYYFIISNESFSANITFNYLHSGADTEARQSYYASRNYVISGNTATFQNTVDINSSGSGGMYYCLFMTTGSFPTSSNQLGTIGSGYVLDCSPYELDPDDGLPSKAQMAGYLITDILGNYGDDLSQAPNVSIDEYVEEKEPVYNADLGCLQNIRRQARFLGSSSGTNQDYQFEYSYGLTTSTGFDLRTEGADVEYLVKIKGGYKTLFGNYYSLPTVKTDSFYAGNGADSFVIYSGTFNDLVQSFRTDDVPITASLEYTEYVYMRPILKDGADTYYGLWSRVYLEDGSYRVDYGTTPDGSISTEGDDEDENFDSVGSDDVDNSLGSGSDWEDAESNSRPDNNGSYTDDELFDQAENLIEQIGEVPQLISELFSFLPPWCLALFGVGFGIIVLLIIYKLIRG